jgi:hypothetical protein
MTRKKLPTNLTLDAETIVQLDTLARRDPDQPGNRSRIVRALIRRAHENLVRSSKKSKISVDSVRTV